MKRGTNDNTPALLQRVNFLYYAISLIPIVAVVYLGITGVIPQFLAILGLFAFFFWIFSFLFALYETWKRRKPKAR